MFGVRGSSAARVAAALLVLLVSCGDPGPSETSLSVGGRPGSATTVPGEAVTVELWHALQGPGGDALQALVDDFNASRDGIVVTTTFMGTHQDVLNALLDAWAEGSPPELAHVRDLSTQFMVDTGQIVPVRDVIPAELIEAFIPAVRGYYADGEGMVALPFDAAVPVVFYNADLFAAAGLGQPPRDWDFSVFHDTCAAVEAAGSPWCLTFGTMGWNFEEILANSGGLYFDADNGRSDHPTRVLFDQGQGMAIFEFLTGLIAEGRAPNLGATWTETDEVFLAGDAGMIFDSVVGAREFHDRADFEVGAAFMPHSDASDRNGVALGGGALWVTTSDTGALDAVGEFLTFFSSRDTQAAWHAATGFVPLRADIGDDASITSFWSEYPSYPVAIEQLASTAVGEGESTNYAALGGLAGSFPEIRSLIVAAYSAVLDDGRSPAEALADAAQQANLALLEYNASLDG